VNVNCDMAPIPLMASAIAAGPDVIKDIRTALCNRMKSWYLEDSQ
jgi:hypothetical protein